MRADAARLAAAFPLLSVFLLNACTRPAGTEPAERAALAPERIAVALDRGKDTSEEPVSPSADLLEDMSRALRGAGARLAVAQAEGFVLPRALPATEATAQGMFLLSNERMMRFPYHWVPGDARRRAEGSTLTYLVVQAQGIAAPGLSNALTEAAIDRALATWNTEVPCEGVRIVKRPDPKSDCTVIDYALGLGGYGDPYAADIVNAGFWPAAFFDKIADRGSRYILGVTFTVVFTDDRGEPVDLDGDGSYDVALKEIYYNNAFEWSLEGGFNGVDLETVALHENGHALGLAHFGNLFVTASNRTLHTSPRAVMNAAYLGALHRPLRTDRAAFCGIYANWPEP